MKLKRYDLKQGFSGTTMEEYDDGEFVYFDEVKLFLDDISMDIKNLSCSSTKYNIIKNALLKKIADIL